MKININYSVNNLHPYKFYSKKCNSEQTSNNDECQYECEILKKDHVCKTCYR